jgi:hypothetical protein
MEAQFQSGDWIAAVLGPLSRRERVRVRAGREEIAALADVQPPSPHPLPLSHPVAGDRQERGDFPCTP